MRTAWSIIGTCWLVWAATRAELLLAEGASHTPEQRAHFENLVRPVLIERCQKCHGAEKQKAGLRLDSRDALLAGGETGPAVVPGQPEQSLLIEALRYAPEGYQMPPDGKLPAETVAAFERWVAEGAVWSAGAPASALSANNPADEEQARQQVLARRGQHWSFQPLTDPAPPAVREADWPLTPVDHFVLAQLEAQDLAPSAPADPYTLLRRVTFDLVGLPPTLEEIAAFEADHSPQAYGQVVERLLASPHYGERWARHWLDLVRYAETAGHEFDFDLPDAWRYRDYCVRAIAGDLSYFDFVVEHLAGDLLESPRWNTEQGWNESLLATGFYFLGESKHSPVDLRVDRVERFDNQIDVLGKTFLGLTIGCARCHDHKFDPITQRDYYALAGLLRSSRYHEAVIDQPAPRQAAAAALSEIQAEVSRRLIATTSVPGLPTLAPPGASAALADFAAGDWHGWSTTGEAFGREPVVEPGARIVPAEPRPTLEWTFAGTADSGRYGRALVGALRSPTFRIEHDRLWYHLRGVRGRVRLVIENFQRIQDPIYGGLAFAADTGGAWHWHAQDVSMWRGLAAYIELLDPGDGYAALAGVWAAGADVAPPVDASPATSPDGPSDAALAAELAAAAEHVAALETSLATPRRSMAMLDGSADDERLHLRGNPARLGESVPRGSLAVLETGAPPVAASTSGRLELARRWTARDNPLLARVLVNRVWHHHFGTGLVRTPDDFGAMGQAPSHPELLDFLAQELWRADGSLKHLHRLMVLSRTYQQTSKVSPAAAERDALNRWLSHMPVTRLEAEAIRDAMLATAGRLDHTVGGPSIPPYLTDFMQGRGRPAQSGPLDGAGRRTLYVGVRRNFLSPLLLAFDFPQPFTTIGRRSRSNVPAQSLALANNPLAIELAGIWTDKLLAIAEDDRARVDRMTRLALGRPAREEEIRLALAYVASERQTVVAESTAAESLPAPATATASPAVMSTEAAVQGRDRAAWSRLAHALFNVKEFIFVP